MVGVSSDFSHLSCRLNSTNTVAIHAAHTRIDGKFCRCDQCRAQLKIRPILDAAQMAQLYASLECVFFNEESLKKLAHSTPDEFAQFKTCDSSAVFHSIFLHFSFLSQHPPVDLVVDTLNLYHNDRLNANKGNFLNRRDSGAIANTVV